MVEIRGFAGAILFFVAAAVLLTRRTQYLWPANWNHDTDTINWVVDHKLFFIVPSILYVPVIFGLQRYLKDRKPFDLGGTGTKACMNYVFWWEAGLSAFSIIGALICLPVALEPLMTGNMGWVDIICKPSAYDRADPRSFWGLLFIISKVPELGDTLFVVLRKKELVLLQWYHHLFTLVMLAGAAANNISRFNNVGLLFTAMNYTVHAFMYTWYAATRIGWKSPKWCMMVVTLMQLSQMIAGLVFSFVASSDLFASECGEWRRQSPGTLLLVYGMYSSYAFLFAKLFYENYLTKKPRAAKKQD